MLQSIDFIEGCGAVLLQAIDSKREFRKPFIRKGLVAED